MKNKMYKLLAKVNFNTVFTVELFAGLIMCISGPVLGKMTRSPWFIVMTYGGLIMTMHAALMMNEANGLIDYYNDKAKEIK